MEKYLKETYGITVYQEQVMLLSQELGGFSKGQADSLRKAMGKKKRDIMDRLKEQFIEGCRRNEYDQNTINKIWSDWESVFMAPLMWTEAAILCRQQSSRLR